MTDTIVYRNDSRMIVRCTTKGCRLPIRVDITTETTMWAHNGRPTSRSSLVMPDGTHRSLRDKHDLARALVVGRTCKDCGGHGFTVDRVDGRKSDVVTCGPRCTGAVGPACDCSCAGERHGQKWSEPVMAGVGDPWAT